MTDPLYTFAAQLLGNPLDEHFWKILRASHTVAAARKGDILLREGEICGSVNFLTSGIVRMMTTQQGELHTFAFIEEGFYFTDYVSVLTGKPSHTCIEALEDIEYLRLDVDAIRNLYASSPHAERYGRLIAEYLFIELNESVYSLRNNDAEQRYDDLMQKQPRLANRVPQYMIAQALNITPEHLSRIRRKKATKS
ncbi:MAG: Crp/Fnr family transcriptional regulator [Candidatus Kapabacteria bacterium]|nr:Crp/Fnr family transcriptional regulator [Candidatus Kapabacteria bacterium]